MTTYDRQDDSFTVPITFSCVLRVRVRGVEDAVDARHAAMKSVADRLPAAVESLDITAGNWPLDPEVIILDAVLEDVDVL